MFRKLFCFSITFVLRFVCFAFSGKFRCMVCSLVCDLARGFVVSDIFVLWSVCFAFSDRFGCTVCSRFCLFRKLCYFFYYFCVVICLFCFQLQVWMYGLQFVLHSRKLFWFFSDMFVLWFVCFAFGDGLGCTVCSYVRLLLLVVLCFVMLFICFALGNICWCTVCSHCTRVCIVHVFV